MLPRCGIGLPEQLGTIIHLEHMVERFPHVLNRQIASLARRALEKMTTFLWTARGK